MPIVPWPSPDSLVEIRFEPGVPQSWYGLSITSLAWAYIVLQIIGSGPSGRAKETPFVLIGSGIALLSFYAVTNGARLYAWAAYDFFLLWKLLSAKAAGLSVRSQIVGVGTRALSSLLLMLSMASTVMTRSLGGESIVVFSLLAAAYLRAISPSIDAGHQNEFDAAGSRILLRVYPTAMGAALLAQSSLETPALLLLGAAVVLVLALFAEEGVVSFLLYVALAGVLAGDGGAAQAAAVLVMLLVLAEVAALSGMGGRLSQRAVAVGAAFMFIGLPFTPGAAFSELVSLAGISVYGVAAWAAMSVALAAVLNSIHRYRARNTITSRSGTGFQKQAIALGIAPAFLSSAGVGVLLNIGPAVKAGIFILGVGMFYALRVFAVRSSIWRRMRRLLLAGLLSLVEPAAGLLRGIERLAMRSLRSARDVLEGPAGLLWVIVILFLFLLTL